jgi:HTH-type transcriptional regulator / antitoxin HigA
MQSTLICANGDSNIQFTFTRMETLKYKVIKTKEQYNNYCNELIQMLESEKPEQFEDEIDLLTVLIEAYDNEHSTLPDYDPVEMLQSLMADHKMKARDLAELLNVSKGYVSEILHYKKGMSKEVIRKLAERFAMRQEAFNRPYKLISDYPVMPEEQEAVME